jgi:hypothetical protein
MAAHDQRCHCGNAVQIPRENEPENKAMGNNVADIVALHVDVI